MKNFTNRREVNINMDEETTTPVEEVEAPEAEAPTEETPAE